MRGLPHVRRYWDFPSFFSAKRQRKSISVVYRCTPPRFYPSCFARCAHSWADISPRDFASLEDNLWEQVGSKVVDPILQKDLRSLKWLDRRIHVAKDSETVSLTLQLPTRLHPSIAELKEMVEKVAFDELDQWISKNGYQLKPRIEVTTKDAKPIPAMARYVENHEDLVKQLGPGLVNVSQYLAVYSCKVQNVGAFYVVLRIF